MVQRVNAPHGPGVPLDEDYDAAVVRIAFLEGAESLELLFATTEFLPSGILPPGGGAEASSPLSESEALRFVRWNCSVAEGVTFHLRIAAGGVVATGELLGPLARFEKALKLNPMAAEPRWPSLVLGTENVPFLAAWHGLARLHHLVAVEAPFQNDPLRRDAVAHWVRERFFFPAEEYPELLGGAHLIAPDPVLASVEERLVDADEGQVGEGVAFALRARPGKSLEGLRLEVTSHGPTGIRAVTSVLVGRPIVLIHFDHRVDQIEAKIVDPRRGLLWHSPPAWFMRSFSVQAISDPLGVPAPQGGAVKSSSRSGGAEALRRGAIDRGQSQRARVRTLFDGSEAWLRVEREILAAAFGYLLVVVERLTSTDLARLSSWAERSSTSIHALATEIQADGLVTPLNGRRAPEVREMSANDLIVGNFIVTRNKTWVFTGALATLGEAGSFLHEVAVIEELSDRFLAAWHAGRPIVRPVQVELTTPQQLVGSIS